MSRTWVLLCGFAAATAVLPGAADQDDAFIGSRRNYWAFHKPLRPEPPAATDGWVRTPVDAFLLEALSAKQLRPSAEAPREKLLRRAYLDLTGLPPTREEADAFLRDRSPRAYDTLVDRLMASPHYGERSALKWLDVVRYADTNGFEADGERPEAWRYRDYVVRAFNSDKPYDRFVREQIAGDELYPGDREGLIALGFLRCGPRHIAGGNQDREMSRQEDLNEMAGSVGATFLGVTVGCARCHNHKFDPILQKDYYRLQAIFAATQFKDMDIATEAEKRAFAEKKKAYDARIQPVLDRIAAIEAPYRARLREQKLAKLEPRFREALAVPKERRDATQATLAKDAEDLLKIAWDELLPALSDTDRAARASVRSEMHRLELERPASPAKAFAVANADGEPPVIYTLKAGDYHQKLEPVAPGFLRVITGGAESVPASAAGRRAALANWLASSENPLTARVMVNRIWQMRMGTGLVRTPNDFGLLGGNPTNRKLLDWLAVEFMEHGWSVKHIDRLILLSSAYRQSTDDDPVKAKADPENKLYWRMNRRRLEGEILRDAVLQVSGNLNPRSGGRPVRVPIEPEIYAQIFTEGEPDNLWPVTPDPAEHDRRSLYLLNKRAVRLPLLANFDQPDAMTSCPVRPASTHALQALSLMNGDFMQRESAVFAARVDKESGGRRERAVRLAYELALDRAPRAEEENMARAFFARDPSLADFCLALLNRNEFVYIP